MPCERLERAGRRTSRRDSSAGELGAVQMHAADAKQGQDCHAENNNSHTTDPMTKTAPELETVREDLNFR